MKKLGLIVAVVAVCGSLFAFVATQQNIAKDSTTIVTEGPIKWMTFEEAIAANNKTPKKLYIDLYTDWCGWCKKMDASTFQDPKVAAYMNEHFYAVKLNAEQKGDITFQGQQFKWVEGGRNGVHTLAYSLLDGQMSYPSFVILTSDYKRILISPGYKNAEQVMPELMFAAQDKYNEMTFEAFKRGSK